MTNKDAIILLQEIEEDGRNVTKEHIEAFDLAIKVLEERPQGEWINKKIFRVNDGLRYIGNCSECGYLQIDLFWGNYCLRCGAKMIGGEYNEKTSKIENT